MSEGIKRNVIKILEIPGKSVTEKYIANMRDKLDKQGLKYTINIVVDENMLHSMQAVSGQTGGDGHPSRTICLRSSLIRLYRRKTLVKNTG